MIATIEGIVSEKIGHSLIVNIGGLGYEVLATTEDWSAAMLGKLAKFYIYDHIREDAHTLFGFSQIEAKNLFIQLLGVNGVGPKVAMQVMSAASLDRLLQSIGAGDADLFKGVSGVGKKTAERIMVDLRGKVGASPGQLVASSHDSVYQALLGLGYSASQAAQAVGAIPASITGEQARIKAALKQLS